MPSEIPGHKSGAGGASNKSQVDAREVIARATFTTAIHDYLETCRNSRAEIDAVHSNPPERVEDIVNSIKREDAAINSLAASTRAVHEAFAAIPTELDDTRTFAGVIDAAATEMDDAVLPWDRAEEAYLDTIRAGLSGEYVDRNSPVLKERSRLIAIYYTTAGLSLDTAEIITPGVTRAPLKATTTSGYVDSAALVKQGTAKLHGTGVAQDFRQAIELFRRAAAMGNGTAMNNIGWMYETGSGVTPDEATALDWYRKAAAEGNSDGMNNLGLAYARGNGVTQDYVEAIAWYRKSIAAGNANAMSNLGVMYQAGAGVEKNLTEAMEWYQKAAAAGDGAAMQHIGWMYANAQGVPLDDVRALDWARRAAAAGDAGGMNELGYRYVMGKGVAASDAEALNWFKKAAAAGDADAMNNLGTMYNRGKGVPQDDQEALKWFRKAAALGHEGAKQAIASLLADSAPEGKQRQAAVDVCRGVIADVKDSVQNFHPANDVQLQAALNRMHADVQQDVNRAKATLDKLDLLAKDDTDSARIKLLKAMLDGLPTTLDLARNANAHVGDAAADEKLQSLFEEGITKFVSGAQELNDYTDKLADEWHVK